jgi:hypothetical protein
MLLTKSDIYKDVKEGFGLVQILFFSEALKGRKAIQVAAVRILRGDLSEKICNRA